MGLHQEPQQSGVGVRDPHSRGGLRLGEGPAKWRRCPAVELPGEDEDQSTLPTVGRLRHPNPATCPSGVRGSGCGWQALDQVRVQWGAAVDGVEAGVHQGAAGLRGQDRAGCVEGGLPQQAADLARDRGGVHVVSM
ncbi:hypothetical protein Sros01_78470 [Streptomyces roseochromogenus]|nr:hypothetical protein Sros01_78470 [Streptomyces roseochromogenus]